MKSGGIILFRAACSFRQGTGHLRRSMTLAEELRRQGYRAMVLADDNELTRKIAGENRPFMEMADPGELLPLRWLKRIHLINALVIDFPRAADSLVKNPASLHAISRLDEEGVSVVSMGHLAHLSHAFRAVFDLYPSTGVHAANYFEGPEFLILRPEFRRSLPAGTQRRSGILVSMGGSDPHDLTQSVLKALLAAKPAHPVIVALGAGYPADRERNLRDIAGKNGGGVSILREAGNMAAIMRKCALGVVCFGTTAYELMSQGTACLALTHYRWQEPSARLFHDLGCCVYLGCAEDGRTRHQLGKRIGEIMKDKPLVKRLAETGRKIVDGKGAERVSSLIGEFSSERKDPTLDRLYVLAHPGDEVFGCAGTILKQVRSGEKIGLVVLGEGSGSRRMDAEDRQSTIRNRRDLKSTLQRVVEKLGVKTWYYYQFEDNRFDRHDLLDIIKVVEAAVKRHRPRVLYTHHPGDLNIDHRISYEAVMTAVRPLKGQPVRSVYSVEVPSSSDWGSSGAGRFQPNWFEDVSGTLNAKLKLAEAYKTEVRKDPHPRSIEGLRQRAKQWGRTVGLGAAEAFVLQRHIEGGEE